jgi:hypothetical protein
MSDEPDDGLTVIELAAAELIASMKRTQLDEIELPIVDESCIWIVTVRKLGIQPNIVPD